MTQPTKLKFGTQLNVMNLIKILQLKFCKSCLTAVISCFNSCLMTLNGTPNYLYGDYPNVPYLNATYLNVPYPKVRIISMYIIPKCKLSQYILSQGVS